GSAPSAMRIGVTATSGSSAAVKTSAGRCSISRPLPTTPPPEHPSKTRGPTSACRRFTIVSYPERNSLETNTRRRSGRSPRRSRLTLAMVSSSARETSGESDKAEIHCIKRSCLHYTQAVRRPPNFSQKELSDFPTGNRFPEAFPKSPEVGSVIVGGRVFEPAQRIFEHGPHHRRLVFLRMHERGGR